MMGKHEICSALLVPLLYLGNPPVRLRRLKQEVEPLGGIQTQSLGTSK